MKVLKKSLLFTLIFGLTILGSEIIYFDSIYKNLSSTIPNVKMVVVYGGLDDRTNFIYHWNATGSPPVFLLSGYPKVDQDLSSFLGDRLQVEDKALTTDQNARYCSILIKKAGIQNVVLALPWYHLPRALFLTRFYLWGTGVIVQPFSTSPLPKKWLLNKYFLQEYLKYWGSLFRVFLAFLGVEDWPPHFSSQVS